MDPERIRQIEAELASTDALTDERIVELRDELTGLLREIAAERPTAESVAAMHALDEHIAALDTVSGERAEGAAALEAEAAEIMARVLGETETAETETPEIAEAVEAEVVEETVEEPEPVLAAAPPRPSLGEVMANRPARHAPAAKAEKTGLRLAVTAEGVNAPFGGEYPSWDAVVDAFMTRHNHIAASDARSGEFSGVVRVDSTDLYGNRRVVSDDDGRANAAIIAEAFGADSLTQFFASPKAMNELSSLVASGGLCAPVDNYYGQLHLGDPGRPVRASLPSFQATRGGIRFVAPVSLSSINADQASAAITTVTMAQDSATKSKTKQTVTCPAISEVDFTALAYRLGFGNVGARTFPERVRNILEVTMDQFARVCERRLLTQIAAGSTSVTTTQVYGAIHDLLGAVGRATAAQRNRHRMATDAPLRLILPAWILDAAIVDISNSPIYDLDLLSVTKAQVEAMFSRLNVNVTWSRDGEALGSALAQDFGAQSGLGAALLDFPDNVVAYLFPEGSWLYLDGGTLDLGLVRDSTLNSTNDYEVMAEVFEDVAFVGIESLRLKIPFCANGSYPAGVTPGACSAKVGFGS